MDENSNPEENNAEGENNKAMGIWEHFNELRVRLLYAVIALVVTTGIVFTQADRLIQFIAIPVGGTERLISIEVTENIGVFMRVSLLGGFILALPVILYEILGFILPGLTGSERRWVYAAIPVASGLFLAGVIFCYYLMLPTAVTFLVQGVIQSVPVTPRLSDYVYFVTNLMFWIGVAFETPLVVFLLAKLKLVTPKTLLKQWRIAIVVVAVVAAIITPTPDPVNMAILMIPLLLIYLLSIGFAMLAG